MLFEEYSVNSGTQISNKDNEITEAYKSMNTIDAEFKRDKMKRRKSSSKKGKSNQFDLLNNDNDESLEAYVEECLGKIGSTGLRKY